jgi:MoxR-like ATPase
VTEPEQSVPTPAREGEVLERAVFEIKRVIVGQDRLVERMLVGLLSRGHLLIEGVPGVAKTLAVETISRVVGGTFARLQFTPDLVPADILGTRIYRQGREQFDVELGPVVANFVLADEINRAPAKVQSALLEVMQEQQVTIGGQTFPAPEPFLVLATQNPIESEGTYPLPEAQVDRFMLKVLVDYPAHDEELTVVARSLEPMVDLGPVLSLEQLKSLQRQVSGIYVDPALISWAVDIASATRRPSEYGVPAMGPYVSYGASPRGPISVVAGARALALIRGRDYVLATDMEALVRDAFRHRLVLSYQALAEEVSADQVLEEVLKAVPAPQIDLGRTAPAAA